MGGGRRGDSDEEAQTPDALSALVKVSSLKNEINKVIMESVSERKLEGDASSFSPPALRRRSSEGDGLQRLSCEPVSGDTAAFSAANDDSLKEKGSELEALVMCHRVMQLLARSVATRPPMISRLLWLSGAV